MAPSTSVSPGPARPCGVASVAPHYAHVVVILMENTSYGGIIGSPYAPYINSIAARCGVASNYHNISHLSLDNYIGMTDGASLSALEPFFDDCSPSPSCEVAGPGIFTQVKSWMAYDESMPSNCDKVTAGFYAARHNPAVYYTRLSNCASRDVPLETASDSPLLGDFASSSKAPAFAFVTPNLCDDMHGATGCPANLTIAGDSWLRKWVTLLTATAVYRQGETAIFIDWDEGGGGTVGENCATNTTDQSCHVPLVVIAPSVRRHTVDGTLLNHYSLLKAAEQLLGVRMLGLARSAPSLLAGFNL